MADNTTLNPGAAGDTIATDDIGGVKHQLVKVEFGAADSATQVSAAAPLPTVQTGALPAGANAIGKLAANSGVDIGDVDVTSAPGTAADGAVGLPGVQYVLAGYDGTNVQALVTDSSGILQVDVVGDSATQAGAAARTADFDTGAGTTTTVFNGIALPASGGPVAGGTSANPIRTDPTGTTPQPVTGPLTDTQLRATPVPVSGTVTASGPLTDTQLRATPVPVSGTVTANAGPGPFPVAGTVAHDGVDSGNPVKTGARARTADVTAVAADDRVDSVATVLGKQVLMPYTLPGNLTKGTANSTGTSDTSVISAPGAGISLYITSLTITNAHATVSTKVQIKSGTTATGYPRVYAAAVGGGASLTFPSPLKLAANEALQFANVTTGADVDVSAVGYTAAE